MSSCFVPVSKWTRNGAVLRRSARVSATDLRHVWPGPHRSGKSHWSALAPFSSLRGWRLLETVEAAGLVDGRLQIDERILHYLAGVDYLDARLKSLTRPMVAPGPMAAEHRRICDAVFEVQERAPELPIVALHGDDFDAQADVAACAAARLGLELHAIRAEDLPPALLKSARFPCCGGAERLSPAGLCCRIERPRRMEAGGDFRRATGRRRVHRRPRRRITEPRDPAICGEPSRCRRAEASMGAGSRRHRSRGERSAGRYRFAVSFEREDDLLDG